MIRTPPRLCAIEAPCKINLHLDIGEKRPDGFHSLESLFASVALADSLLFECFDREGDCVLSTRWETPGETIPEERNLVYRAVSLFRERTGFLNALSVRLVKRVPAGAGLGGGSSDAASALLAMNALAGEPLSEEALAEMAAGLGSDVPFFLSGGAAFIGGRGEKVERVRAPEGLSVLLVKPPFNSDTSFAYRMIDDARRRGFCEKRPSILKEALIRSLRETPETWPFRNDFLPLFLDPRFSESGPAAAYRAILDALLKNGASFAGLSGSGSSCFGIFSSPERAEQAADKLAVLGKFAVPDDLSASDKLSAAKLPPENYIKTTFFLANRARPTLQ